MTERPLDDDRVLTALSRLGADLEKAFREAGTSLPPGKSGTELVRALLEEMRDQAQTDEGRRVSEKVRADIDPIYRALETELPGGSANPAFAAALLSRLQVWASQWHDTQS
jgi:hypothetical protein